MRKALITVAFLGLLTLMACSASHVKQDSPKPVVKKTVASQDHPFAKIARGECPCPDGDFHLFIHRNNDNNVSIVCSKIGSESYDKHYAHADRLCCGSGDRISPEICPELYGIKK